MASRLDAHIARLKARDFNWPIPWEIVEDLARREDCRLVAYRCPSGVWTLGWGETEQVTPGMSWTGDQCDSRLYMELCEYTRKVEAMLNLPANESQLGALVSLAYNIGLRGDKPKKGLYWSSVRRLHNAGDTAGAARAFGLYNQARNPATGRLEVLAGLASRRASEAAFYLRPVEGAPSERMPQAVAPESSLGKSPINLGGAATVLTGIATGASTVSEQLGTATGVLASAKSFASQIVEIVGVPPGVLAAVVLIAAGLLVMHWRKKQRDGGFA